MIHDTSCGMFRLFCGMDCCIDYIPYSILYGTLRVTTFLFNMDNFCDFRTAFNLVSG